MGLLGLHELLSRSCSTSLRCVSPHIPLLLFFWEVRLVSTYTSAPGLAVLRSGGSEPKQAWLGSLGPASQGIPAAYAIQGAGISFGLRIAGQAA